MGYAMRVMVVDDEEGVRMTVAANLELAGFSVVTAASGDEAISATASQGPFDLVLTDLRMPRMSGAELIKRLRTVQPGVPMVLMTAHAREDLVSELYEEGLFAVLHKPFDVDDVVSIVLRAARRPSVLVVDDARAPSGDLVDMLSSSGLRTLTAKSPGEALLVAGTNQVDVCVVEARLAAGMLPDLLQRNPSLRVIAVSASDTRDLLGRASSEGAFACLERPVQRPELVRMIARARATPVA